jgi:hypothetical protein
LFRLTRNRGLRKEFCQAKIKSGKVLPPETAEMAKQFYVSHESGKIMPGKNNYIWITLRRENS